MGTRSSTLPSTLLVRRVVGLAIVVLGAAWIALQGWHWIAAADPRVGMALVGGLAAAGATALGTLPILLSRSLSQRVHDSMLGFGAGVMLAACSFSLIVPGLAAARDLGASAWEAGFIVATGILAGGALLLLMDRVLPHEHFIKGVEGSHVDAVAKRVWLFVFAIILHNLPEGLAIGVAYAGADPVQAGALTTGIAIQDVPEGLVVAAALLGAGYSRLTAVGIGILSGLVEPIGAVVGAGVVTLSATLLPWGLAFAAGAMLFVISHEIIPESHRKGHEASATGGLMIGFVVMMLLDTALA